MATDLATLLQQIPLAEDGKLITRDYHNSLRAALLALAGQAGTPANAARQLVLVPNFIVTSNNEQSWRFSGAIAIAGERGAAGILPIDLRDNETIASVTVTGRVPSDFDGILKQVQLVLVQQSLADPDSSQRAVCDPDSAEVEFENSSGRFSVTFAARFSEISIGRLPDRGKAAKAAPMTTFLRAAVDKDLQRMEIWGVALNLQ